MHWPLRIAADLAVDGDPSGAHQIKRLRARAVSGLRQNPCHTDASRRVHPEILDEKTEMQTLGYIPEIGVSSVPSCPRISTYGPLRLEHVDPHSGPVGVYLATALLQYVYAGHTHLDYVILGRS